MLVDTAGDKTGGSMPGCSRSSDKSVLIAAAKDFSAAASAICSSYPSVGDSVAESQADDLLCGANFIFPTAQLSSAIAVGSGSATAELFQNPVRVKLDLPDV